MIGCRYNGCSVCRLQSAKVQRVSATGQSRATAVPAGLLETRGDQGLSYSQ